MPALDFSGVKELEAVPAGEYLATIADAKWVAKPKSGEGKYGYYAVKFTISSDDESEFKGRSVYRNYSTSPDSLFATKQTLLSAGMDEEIFQGSVDLDEAWKEAYGAELIIVVSNRQYDGKTKSQVDRTKAPNFEA